MERGFSPLDEELGLLPGNLTPSLVEDLVRLGTWMPFGEAAKLMGHFRRVDVSEATVRRATEQSGAAYIAVQRAQVAELELELLPSPEGPPLQQLSVDGAMVSVLHGEWREVKTLAVGTVEEPVLEKGEWEVHARDLSYFSRLAEHQDFSEQALVEIHRRGVEKAGEVCAVVDGAEWQQKFIDLHRPDAVRILDFGHAAGYVAQVGQAVFGSGTAATSGWVETQRHQLKHGDSQEVLEEMRRLGKELADAEEADEAALKTVRGSLGYLEKRQEQIRYADFQAMGYPIGSGIVESANKLVVEARLKGSGMHWAEEHVNPMVALRTIVCSDLWEEAWPQTSQRLRDQARERGVKRRAERASVQPSKESVAPASDAGPVQAAPEGAGTGEEASTLGPAENKPAKGAKRPAPNHPWRRMSAGRARLSPTPAMASAKI